MKWSFFDEKDNEVINLLKQSKQDFKFDEKNVKARLFMAMGTSLPAAADDHSHRLHFMPKYMAGLIVCILLLGTTAGISVASNKAHPGEKLYKVQTLQNNLVLSLPIPDTQKAQYRTDIVAQRLDELEHIETSVSNPTQLSAEIKASSQSISDAVTNVAAIQKQAASNNTKILSIVKQLNDLSTAHEQKMEALKNSTKDEKLKQQIEKSLETIRAERLKLSGKQDDADK